MGTQTAAGQIFGYSLQFPRALYRLLNASEDERVAIEFGGDVSVIENGVAKISEEDKSSLVGNPITDGSSNLWKTFFNWINYVLNKELDVVKTSFILYANSDVPEESLVLKLSESDGKNADSLLADALNATASLKAPQAGKNAFTYKEFVLKQHPDIFKQIIANFSIETDNSNYGIAETIHEHLKNKVFIEECNIEEMYQQLLGIVFDLIMKKIGTNQNAIINKSVFFKKANPIINKIRNKQLTNFAINSIPTKEERERVIKEDRPTYVKQLELIETNEENLLDAVVDYYKSRKNRSDWIENEIVDENDINDFEEKVKRFYKNKKENIELRESDKSAIIQGKLLLNDCKLCDIPLNNQNTPNGTISGLYHEFADKEEIGWHPNWEKLLKADKQ
jgi:hypothetical protein